MAIHIVRSDRVLTARMDQALRFWRFVRRVGKCSVESQRPVIADVSCHRLADCFNDRPNYSDGDRVGRIEQNDNDHNDNDNDEGDKDDDDAHDHDGCDDNDDES